MANNSDLYPPTYDNCDEVSDQCQVEFTIYGADLSTAAAIFFFAAFVVLFLAQIFFGIRAKTWSYATWLGLGTLLEIVGYAGRYSLSKNPWGLNAFIVQYLTLLLAPTLIAAAISVTFKHLVIWYGPQWSLLRPKLYPWVFVGTDFLSIFIQIVGGGLISLNSTGNGSETTQKLGEALVIGGVAFQVANMLCCAGLMLMYARRRNKAMKSGVRPINSASNLNGTPSGIPAGGKVPLSRVEATQKEATRTRLFIYALGVAYAAIIIRCGYRIAETIPSLSHDVMRNETLFLVLDGGMVLLAIGAVTILHPCVFFPFLGVKTKDRKEGEAGETYAMLPHNNHT
ncbi:phospholipid-translocating ATPase [Fusarium albosuccineum]|uniref:Phospholipid-translocating ATPase n=1 Tax=Fusarium albosuccineum TaxID=1237068 RepID=A0A8H4KMJ2_9HYPO|nr:phospholipid-translocating ATPase [Fusarium albosuccineum]